MNVSVSGILPERFRYDGRVEKVLSSEGKSIFEVVNFVVICGIIGLFGITTNIVNILIFCSQGFNNTVNIGFLALAISDLCCLFTLEWISVCMNPFFVGSGIPWVVPEVMYLSGGWPHVCFSRITSYITLYITAERYLCVALPMKMKEMVTPRRTTLILILIFTANLATLIPEYTTSYFHWKTDPDGSNATAIGLVFTSSRKNLKGICFVIHSLLSTTSFFGVVVFTVVLVIKLRKSSEWRKKATSGHGNARSISTREQKTVKMVALIASVLILCNTPGAIVSMATFIVGPELSVTGKYINVCISVWSIACSFQTVNSSVNVFFYYNMSSKYKQTFDDIFSNFYQIF